MADRNSFTTIIRANVEKMRQGDPAATDELFCTVQARLRDLGERMFVGFPSLKRWCELDDVLQNVALRLWRALETVTPTSTRDFLGLAAVQMRRELIDLARSFQGPYGLARRHDSVANIDSLAPTHDDNADLQRWTDLHEEAARLPEAEREVFDLIFYHGWTQSDVAEMCQVDVRTVRRRWAAAILQLRHVLADLPLESQ
jgi:RNA polymerase sigma factor (sigma-70 family)